MAPSAFCACSPDSTGRTLGTHPNCGRPVVRCCDLRGDSGRRHAFPNDAHGIVRRPAFLRTRHVLAGTSTCADPRAGRESVWNDAERDTGRRRNGLPPDARRCVHHASHVRRVFPAGGATPACQRWRPLRQRATAGRRSRVLFKLDFNGAVTTLHYFLLPWEPQRPFWPLIETSSGQLAGVTLGVRDFFGQVDAPNVGTAFLASKTASQQVTVLHRFSLSTGARPYRPLLEAPEALYGLALDRRNGEAGRNLSDRPVARSPSLALEAEDHAAVAGPAA